MDRRDYINLRENSQDDTTLSEDRYLELINIKYTYLPEFIHLFSLNTCSSLCITLNFNEHYSYSVSSRTKLVHSEAVRSLNLFFLPSFMT